MLYVNPDDFNASDLISNNGNSPTRPFKTIQRALLEIARFSYVAGQNNDKYDQFTINLSPGEYIIDNRPGKANTAEVPELSDQSNFDILDPANDLYKFNSTEGGLVIPRGTSLVGMDLRKTRVRPRYVPDPANGSFDRTSIFKVTGACYFWQFSLFDAFPTSHSSGQGGVYNTPGSNTIVNANYSHHKVTCFTYADQSDLDLFYAKAARAFASIPTTAGELESRVQETRIVGPLQQAGQKGISTISINSALVTIVTTGPHEVFEGQQITVEDIGGAFAGLNGTYYVTAVNNDTELTITVPGLTSGSVPSADLTNAIVKAEIDTVDSSSPYIFNCSLRSTYGLCGLWADGSKVSGFKSMVVAQFTGVSLQKDDRAFVKFTETTSPNPSFVLEGGASDSIALHQDSAGFVFYRGDATTGWRHYHIRVSNNAFIQSVSVFAVGYAEQHLIEAGGDYSITNSNSNFGTMALIADGFRPDAFTLDKKGKFTHIVPPQALGTAETQVPYYPLDVQKSRSGVAPDGEGTKLYLFEQLDANKTPVFNINQYKTGGKIGDEIFANLTNPQNSRIEEFKATIDPSGIETREISNVNVTTDEFTTTTTNNFETGTPIRIYSSTSYLPLGMESNKLYYAIKVSNTSFKIAPSEEDARAGAGGAANSIVNIRSIIPANALLKVKAYVSDTNPELPRFNVDVNASLEEFSTGTFPHGFTTGDKVFFKRRIIAGNTSTGLLPLIQDGGNQNALSLTTEYFVIVMDAYKFKIATDSSNANNGVEIPIDTNGDANTLTVYRNIQKSPLRYDPVQGCWFIAVKADSTNTIHPILTSSNTDSIYSNVAVTNTENTFFRRLADERQLADRTYRLRYVIPKTELNARPPIVGYVVQRKTDANNQVIPYDTENQTNQVAPFDRVFFVYRSDTILPHIPAEQDGVYYLTILMADIAPTGDQFNSQTDTFNFLKYSQDVAKIYPDLDKDNPAGNPAAAKTVADNLIHGLVYQDDDRSSITREAVVEFANDCGFPSLGATLDAQTGKATSGQENRLTPFNANSIEIGCELRRTSQVRAGNQTFEYTGFGSGNYSTGFPSKQEKVLSDKEVLYSQAQRRRAGVVFYSGLNAYGDLYVGNQKINAITGETEILDKPILRVAGSAVVADSEFVPYVTSTKNVIIDGTLTTVGNASATPNLLRNHTIMDEGASIATRDPVNLNRALLTHDVNYRPKGSALAATATNGTIKQTALSSTNLVPVIGAEGTFKGDKYFKNTIGIDSRHEGYIYVGPDISNQLQNAGWRNIGLIGTGHLTSEETSWTANSSDPATIEPYDVYGKFGINKTSPSTPLHVKANSGTAITSEGHIQVTGNGTFSGDIAINGGDITSTSTNFDIVTTSTTVKFATSATTLTFGASNAPLGAGTGGGTSVATLDSDKLVIKGDIEISGKFDSGTAGSKTAVISTTAEKVDFMITPSTVNFSTQTTNAFTGATSLNFGADTGTTTVKNNLHVNKNVTVAGNLTVQGTTTTVNSTVTTIKDPLITLGGGTNNATLTSNDGKDRGLELMYYDDGTHSHTTGAGAKKAYMYWDVSAMAFRFYQDAPISDEDINETNATGTGFGKYGRIRQGSIRLTPVDWTSNGHAAIIYDDNPFNNFSGSTETYTAGDHSTELSANARSLFSKFGVESQVICMWNGNHPPHGWRKCDGGSYVDRYGTARTAPDLRAKFIIGAGSGGYTYGNTGGNASVSENTGDNNNTPSVTHTLSVNVLGHTLTTGQIPSHRHGMIHGHPEISVQDPGHTHGYKDRYYTDEQGDKEFGEKDNDGKVYEQDKTNDSAQGLAGVTLSVPQNDSSGQANISPDRFTGNGTVTEANNPGLGSQGAHDHQAQVGGDIELGDTKHQHSMSFSILPPYYALTFIIKL